MTLTLEQQNPVLVEVFRGGRLESMHCGAFVVCDSDGDVKVSVGDVDRLIYPRSSVKVVQAVPLIESGAADAYGFSDEELAVACASHNGEELHVNLVGSMLEKVGLQEEHLRCGSHWPLGRRAERALAACGGTPSAFHNNCSGKHAGMLAVCKHLGLPLEGYFDPDHPLQVTICNLLEEFTGLTIDRHTHGVDGCSLPNWPLPLKALARFFSKLGQGSDMSDERTRAAQRLINAGFSAPKAMGGERRFVSEILAAFPGEVYVKEGAEGVYGAAFVKLGLGFAAKIDDGGRRAVELLTATVAAHLLNAAAGQGRVLDDYRETILRSWNGDVVGGVHPSAKLSDAVSDLVGAL